MLRIDRLDTQTKTDAEAGVLKIAEDSVKPAQWRFTRRLLDHSIPLSSSGQANRIWVLANGGPIEWEEEGKRPRRLAFLSPLSTKAAAKGVLNVFGQGEVYEMAYDSAKVRAGLYPTFLRKAEDYQFPLPGQKHVFLVINGEVNVTDRNSQTALVVRSGDALLLSRDAEECLNLQAVADSDSATVLWAVLHQLP